MLSTYFCLSTIVPLPPFVRPLLLRPAACSWIMVGTIGKLSLWSIAFTSYRAFAYFTANRYDCDHRKSIDAYPAKDRPIRDSRLLFIQPDRINTIRVFPRGYLHLPVIISTPITIIQTISIDNRIDFEDFHRENNKFF